MLTKWLSKLEPVHAATTREEREAIYRFRYTVYFEEYGREIGNPDHERRWVTDADDEKHYSTQLYTGSLDDISGAVRIRHWQPGEIPDYERRELSMDLIPDIDQRHTAEIGRFMIRRSLRGKMLLGSFAHYTYDMLAGEKGTELTFCYCAPGLVRFYRKLGARPFGGRLVHTPDGMMVPLVSVMSDYDYYRKVGSPMAPQVKKHFGPGKRPNVDTSSFEHLFGREAQPIELDPDVIWEEVQDGLVEQEETSEGTTFLSELPPDTLKRLATEGFILDVPPDTLVTREDYGEKEMFVVLDGVFEVVRDGQRLNLLSEGELFGEIAFFRKEGRRTASVRSLTEGRLLVLRGKSLDNIIDEQPKLAARILMSISRVMAERMAGVLSVAASATEGDDESD
jgi:hypothetical protein